MADSDITFSTALDNSGLEKGLKQAEREVESLKSKLEADEEQKTFVEKAMERNEEAIHRNEQALESLKAKIVEIERMGASDPASYVASRSEMDAAKAEMAAIEAELSKQIKAQDDYNAKWQAANDKAEAHVARLEEAKARAAELGSQYAEAYRSGASAFDGGLSAMSEAFEAFASRVGRRLKQAFVFSVIYGAISKLKGYLSDAVWENGRLVASVSDLRAVLQGMVAPAAAVVAHMLAAAVNAATAMLVTLARLVDSVFHTDLAGSIERAREAARAAQAASKATDRQASSTKRLAKATKEAARQLMSFDELNVLNAETSDAAADAVDPAAGLPDTAEAASAGWDGIDVGKIDAVLAEIMAVLGLALMAVGAILAFSGINVPLGISLMALGALMAYTAFQEQWDKLPSEVKGQIEGLAAFLGMMLLAIGAILALASPATAALGVGLMAAGAVMLAAAVALKWGELSEETKDQITDLMRAVGAAMIVIGVILALSGAAVPLGVGLMVAGAVMMVSAIALKWGELSEDVQDQITDMLSFLGTVLIVIGVFLIATGVGVPLGIACILAGVGAMVTAAALNWDYIVDKVKGIWNKIKTWFNDNVRPVFTAKWWKEKFKSVANGLISALNMALSGVDDFINSVAGGVSDILNFFGVTGWSFTLTTPKIPMLAEGAVIPPNRRFMAVLGDQSHGRNLEAPEDLIRQIVREESGNAALLATARELLSAVREGHVLECDGHELARVVNGQNRIRANIYGA